MTFLWPWMLSSLLLVPAAIVGYVWLRRRVIHGQEPGTMDMGFGQSRWARRNLPFTLFAGALLVLLIAIARPQIVIALPRLEGTVILAFDVSNSMIANDLQPTRLDAAKVAATRFVDSQPDSIDIGVVAFSDGALILQTPTNKASDILDAIERLDTQGGTAIGDGILTSLGAIAGKPIDLGDAAAGGETEAPGSSSADISAIDIDFYGSAVVILLTDGENTSPVDPVEVAELAAKAGVRIHPVGIGSAAGAVVEVDGFNVATTLNEDLLEEIATVSYGTYHAADDAGELADIYSNIDLELSVGGQEMEVTGLLGLVGLLLLISGAVLTTLWYGRLP